MLFGEGEGETSGSYDGRVRMFLTSIGGGASPASAPAVIAAAPVQPLPPVAGPEEDRMVPVPGGLFSGSPSRGTIAATTAGASGSFATPPPPKPTTANPLAALPAPQPREPTAAPVSNTSQPPVGDHIGWEEIAGRTGGEQLKTVLAGLGILLLLWQVIRWVA